MRSSGRKQNKPPPDNLPIASILDTIGEIIEIVDVEWNFFYINQAAADLGGKIASEIRGKNVWVEFPELVGSYFDYACRRTMREQVRIDFEFYFVRCAKWLEIHLHPTAQYLTLYGTEITRRVQAEIRIEHLAEIESLNVRLQHRIEESAAMNEALIISGVRQHELTETAEILNTRLQRAMQESHHRIKNNLQVVSALVEMQRSENGETVSDDHLKRINQHIRVLASIHDLLTQQTKDNAEAASLNTRATLGELIPMLQETSGDRHITTEIADVLLPVDKAASLSLLVSECISNAIKHSKGDIEVTLRVEGSTARLEVCDEGSGFPPDFDPHTAANTGLSLIDATARYDLRGAVRYENHSKGGGCVAVTFPLPAPVQNEVYSLY